MIKTLGLVLKKQNIGETDRIVTIFSPSLGKKRIVARAVRKTTSRLAGHLDTFMVSQVMLTDHPDLPKVTSAVLVESFEEVRGSLEMLERAYAISRIIERVIVEDVPQQSIFRLTVDALARLNDGQTWSTVWLTFLGSLTLNLGLSPGNFSCQLCSQKITGSAYWLEGDRSFICSECNPEGPSTKIQANTVKLLQLLRKESFDNLRRISIPLEVAKEAEEIYLKEITQWFNKPWSSYSSLRTKE